MFVGRERELVELTAALERARAGSGGLYLVAGEPGIGKTSLAAEVATAARARGVRVSWGRCWEAGGAPAYWPWREALEGLGLAFPEAATVATGDLAEARFALFREVASALGREAARQPLLLVLEDLHAADRSSLLLLEFLAGALRTQPVLAIGTYRDLEAGLRAECADVLARLGRAGQVLQLARLRRPDVATLVRGAIDDADDRLVAAVYDMTHGNPLFVGEVVRDVRARGGELGESIPLGVREVIRQRLALVSADARGVLEAAAVLGVELGAADLGRMVPGAASVIDDAIRSGLVVARGDRLRFAHALYREALYHDLPRARRHALHRDAARAVAAGGAPLAEIAHHLLEAGPDAAPDAIDHAIRAAAHALDVFAFEDAEALLERARAAIPPAALDTALHARVLIAQGEARLRAGAAGGRELCLEAARIARALADTALLARAALAYGAVWVTAGVDPVMVGLLGEALAALPDEDSALRAQVMARLAAARQPSLERDRDIRLALDAVAMARRVAGPRELLAVYHSTSGVIYGTVLPEVRLAISLDQERVAEELGDTTRLLQARVRIAMDHLELGNLAAYADLATRYEQLAARVGRAAAPWRVPLMRSMLAIAADRFDESERWQAESRRLEPERPGARRAQTFHRIGFLRAAERHAELRACLPEVRGTWLEMPYGVHIAEPRVASCLARIGAETEVRAILDELPADHFAEMINGVPLAEAIWLAGTADEARRLLPLLDVVGDRWAIYWLDCEIVEAPSQRARAYLLAVAGDWAEAERQFARGLALVDAAGRRSLAARMRFEYGDLLLRHDRDPARARALVAEARAGADALGLSELVALIDRRHGADHPRPIVPRDLAIRLEGEYYAVVTARGTLRFKASRGMQYLARLVATPDVDVHVLDLAGSGDPVDRGDAGELLDRAAFQSYRARLEALRDEAEDAEAIGDAGRADAARAEMEAIAAELAKGTGIGGRARRAESAVDRARSAVQRRIKDALDRIAEQDPELGRWLKRAVRTGNYCSFRPDS